MNKGRKIVESLLIPELQESLQYHSLTNDQKNTLENIQNFVIGESKELQTINIDIKALSSLDHGISEDKSIQILEERVGKMLRKSKF